ncbi:MAG: glucose-6-phosphate dehydrogenase, partial [Deltaproteobacteria bacterium]
MKTSGLRPGPTIFVIFGAGGDLAWRKLIPALYNLFLDGWMPSQYQILGMGHGDMSDEDYRTHLRKGVDKVSRRGEAQKESWDDFASRISFVSAELGDKKIYKDLSKRLAALEKEWDGRANHVFYLALPPSLIGDVVKGLSAAGLNRDQARIVVEKPFGSDLESAKELNRTLGEEFEEKQIFRIDHYLGKETVQNILAFRFGN